MIPFLKEILEQPGAVRDTAEYLRQASMPAGGYSRIVATGMGSSYFVAGAFSLILEGRGVPAFCENAGELLHYGQKVLVEDTLLVAISQSGESYETVQLLRELSLPKERVVAITNEPQSSLASMAGTVIQTKAGKEDMTSTKTFITSWMAALALADSICGIKTKWDPDWLAEAVEKTLSRRDQVSLAADLVGDASFIQFTARGIDFQVARQSALMCNEAIHLSSSALTGGDFRHGPLEMVAPGMTVVIISHSQSPTRAQSLKLVDDVLRYGGNVLLVTDRNPHPGAFPGIEVLETEPCAPELFPVLAVLPLQLLIVEIASRRGIVPGDFSHGSKVTLSE